MFVVFEVEVGEGRIVKLLAGVFAEMFVLVKVESNLCVGGRKPS